MPMVNMGRRRRLADGQCCLEMNVKSQHGARWGTTLNITTVKIGLLDLVIISTAAQTKN